MQAIFITKVSKLMFITHCYYDQFLKIISRKCFIHISDHFIIRSLIQSALNSPTIYQKIRKMAGVELLNILTNKNCNGRHGTKLKQE